MRRGWLRRTLNRMEIDQAVFYALTARVWQFVAGPITMLFIAFYFTSDLQGYYYTFWSLLAAQSFVELGLQLVIVYVASHEWAGLSLDADGSITGNENSLSRLASLARLVIKWYSAASLLLVVGVGIAGFVFFSQQSTSVSWHYPWLTLVLLTAMSLWLSPLVALLEGCNQIAVVNFYRTLQAITGNAIVWICIPLGAQLWTAVAVAFIRLCWECYLLGVRYRRFWAALLKSSATTGIAWFSEIWPLQWRQAVHSVLGYFSFHLFTPLMFFYHGSAVAGQMGMTWTIITAVQAVSFAWVQTRTPLFGMLIAKKDYRELDRVFRRVASIAIIVMVATGTIFFGCVVLIHSLEHPFAGKLASRLLPVAPTLVFVLAVIVQQIPKCQNIYIRAHKRDPFLLLSCVTNISAGLSIWQLGRHYGPLGAAVGYLCVVTLIQLPGSTWIWLRCRTAWHEPLAETPSKSA